MTVITAEPINWSAAQKVTFRFFLIFFVLYIFFNPNGVLPYSDDLFNIYIPPFHNLIQWLALHVLHTAKPITIFTNGSGDTTYDYLIILLITTIAVTGTIVLSITGRNTRNYNKLFYWLTVVIRYYVAITMLGYGFFKVIKLQFPAPSFDRLLEPVGNMSPMGLAWTYFGYSTAFNYFTGFAEITTGLLLFFRKTSTLGAILGLAVAGNIMAVNYCFDVPVKLLSTFLVLMCLFILAKDAGRLINFFFKNKIALPSNLTPHRFKARWKNITLTCVKYLLVIYTLFFNFMISTDSYKKYGPDAKKPPLYGLYNVESFIKNKDTLLPLTTDTIRWSKLMITYAGSAQIKLMNDSISYYSFKPDTVKHNVIINTRTDTLHKYLFSYIVQKPDMLLLKGKWKQDSVSIRLRKMDPGNFFLLKRGFRWINEYPFNR